MEILCDPREVLHSNHTDAPMDSYGNLWTFMKILWKAYGNPKDII